MVYYPPAGSAAFSKPDSQYGSSLHYLLIIFGCLLPQYFPAFGSHLAYSSQQITYSTLPNPFDKADSYLL